MSVQAGPIYKRYAANGVATVYAIPFLVITAADLLVTLDGNAVTSGFTLSGLGGPTSSATFTIPPTGDLLFRLNIPIQRLTDYQTNGDLLAKTLNLDMDRLWLAIKQILNGNDRSLATNILEPEGLATMPLKAVRALRVLGFDADGNPIVSTLTLAQLEQQPTNASASAAAAAVSAQAAATSADAASTSATNASASATLAQKWAAEVVDTPVSGGLYSARHYATKAAANAIWGNQPIGVPIPIWDHITGCPTPPTNDPAYRYIKLTASDSYNTGVLTSESVSGSAPAVLATAVVNDTSSPINGRTVQLINTERRALRAGSSGTLEADAMQGHVHGPGTGGTGFLNSTASGGGAAAGGSTVTIITNTGGPVTDGTNGTPRTANETRAKNIGATYYMRIR